MKTVVINRVSVVLGLAVCLPACGLFDKSGGEEEHASRYQNKLERQPVQPVPHEQLLELFPNVEGWERSTESKASKAEGHDISLASAQYDGAAGEQPSTLKLEIIDGSYVSSVYAPFAVMSHSGGATDVHKRTIKLDGHPGIEDWNTQTGSVSVAVLVARRFVVTLRGSHVSPQAVKQFLNAIDVKKLASWAGEPG